MPQDPQSEKTQIEKTPIMRVSVWGRLHTFFSRHKCLTWLIGGLFGAALAIILGLFIVASVFMSHIERYHHDIELAASKALNQPVRIARIDAFWHGINPTISLEQITVSNHFGQSQLKLESIDAIVSWKSLFSGEIRFARLAINRPDLIVKRDVQGRFYLAGILIDFSEKKENGMLPWLMKQAEITISDGTLRWQNDFGKAVSFDIQSIYGTLENDNNDHHFEIQMTPGLKGAETLQLKGALVMADEGNQFDHIKVMADKLSLDTLNRLIPFLPVNEKRSHDLSRYQIGGLLSDMTIEWYGLPVPKWAIKTSFEHFRFKENVHLTAVEKALLPVGFGVDGLSGELDANSEGGKILLNSHQAVLSLPIYPEKKPLVFDELKTDIVWTQSEQEGLVLDIRDLVFRQQAMTGRALGQYIWNPHINGGGNILDLTAEIDNLEVTNIKRYIPLQTPKELSDWLSAALKGGKVSRATIRTKGQIDNIPYPNGDGIFEIRAKLNDVSMNYAPFSQSIDGKRSLWPDLEHIQGEFQMKGKAITVHADSAMTQGVNLHDVNVVIPDVLQGAPTLEITGYSNGSMTDHLAFVKASPVYELIDHLTENTTATGNGRVDIKIHLPLQDLNKTKVDGHLKFQNNDIVLLEDLPVISGVQGELYFTDRGFSLNDLIGQFLGAPVQIQGGTIKGEDFLVKVSGLLNEQGIRRTYTTGAMRHLARMMEGQAPFTVDIRKGQIHIETDLQGIGINLPEPFYKAKGQKRPLSITLKDKPTIGSVQHDELSVRYGEGYTAKYFRIKKGHDRYWRVASGGFGIHRPVVAKKGLMVNAEVSHFDLNEWIDFIVGFYSHTSSSHAGSSAGYGLLQYLEPHWFSLKANTFDAFGLRGRQVIAKGSRQNGNWEIDALSDILDGHITYIENNHDYPHGFLGARLKYFDLPFAAIQSNGQKTGTNAMYHGALPSMNIETANLGLFDRHQLGHAKLQAESVVLPKGNEWIIKKLMISNKDAFFSANGKWVALPGMVPMTKLDFQLETSNEGGLFKRLLLDGFLKDGVGVHKGSIRWHGLPFVPDFSSLSGKLSINLTNGEFQSVKPGAAKLLSILSLKSIPRRIGFDLRDIVSEGFAYDSISGDFDIVDGVIRTDNLKVMGLAAEISMNGLINMVDMTQDMKAVVVPEINAAGASIAVGVLNPVIGAGTLLAQVLARSPLMQKFTLQYHITGSWENPLVQQIGK